MRPRQLRNMKTMSLSERVALLKRDYGLSMAPATLRSVYLKHNVRFRSVDV